jgi:opacity protein-like surface antigen
MRRGTSNDRETTKLSLSSTTRLAAFLLLAAGLLVRPARLCAQVVPSAYGSSENLWVGAEYSNFLPDFGPSDRLEGVGVYVDLNMTPRWGVEGEARFLSFNGFHGETQTHYLIGPKVQLLRQGKLRPFAKFLVGLGQNQFPFTIGTGRYLALAPGAGADYRLTRKIAIRVEYEYQLWSSAPGIVGEPSNGMAPSGFSAGFAYKLFGH